MIKTKVAILVLALIGMVSIMSPAGAAINDITLFVNEHVSLSANPGTTGGSYSYLWTASWTPKENGADVNMLVSQNPLVFDAPSTPGPYTLKVLVSDTKAPTNCKAEKEITLNVVKCCPTIDPDYCVTDKPTWCWYDSCGIPTGWNPVWTENPSSIVFNWYVPSTATTTLSTSACYSPNLEISPYVIPDTGTPTQSNSLRLDVTQTTEAHGGSSITLYSCEKNFDLHWVPVPSIDLTS